MSVARVTLRLRVMVKIPYPVPLDAAGTISKALSEYFPDAVVVTDEPDFRENMTIWLNPITPNSGSER